MTDQLYSTDAYLRECEARVIAVTDDGVVLDRTVFYPGGGGQPCDTSSPSPGERACQFIPSWRTSRSLSWLGIACDNIIVMERGKASSWPTSSL